MANAKAPEKTRIQKAREAYRTVELFYDRRDGNYWHRLNGRFIRLSKSDLKLQLRTLGITDDAVPTNEGMLPQIDWPFWNAFNNRAIDYAGSLAGHRIGVFEDGSKRKFLVTDEAFGVWDDLPKKPSEPPFFTQFVEELLPGDQSLYFCHWVSNALRSLRRGDFQPGQAVVFAGPAQCGKSLMQNMITEILGGRSANPFRYMMGLTQFNQDLACAEHWQIEDPATTVDIRARRNFGAMLKEVTVNRDFSIHQKGKDALALPLLRRATISINDETESVAIVPPMEPSIQDKIFLFHCARVQNAFARFRVVKGTPALPGLAEVRYDGELDRSAIWAAVKAEVPLIRAWLLTKFTIVPVALRDDRFGIKAWHHPDLLEELSTLAPEMRLLQLIDEVFFSEPDSLPIVKRKLLQIEQELRGNAAWGGQIDRLLGKSSTFGNYMGKLVKAAPNRIEKVKLHGSPLWSISKPQAQKELNE